MRSTIIHLCNQRHVQLSSGACFLVVTFLAALVYLRTPNRPTEMAQQASVNGRSEAAVPPSVQPASKNSNKASGNRANRTESRRNAISTGAPIPALAVEQRGPTPVSGTDGKDAEPEKELPIPYWSLPDLNTIVAPKSTTADSAPIDVSITQASGIVEPSVDQRQGTQVATTAFEVPPELRAPVQLVAAQQPPPPPSTQGDSSGSTPQAEGQETIGVPPPKEQPQFLRNESILLKPGSYQWEWGINYTFNSTVLPVGQAVGEAGTIVTSLRQVNRVLQMPLELRVGLSETLQGAVTLPFGWSNSEISIAGLDEFENQVGIGDIGLSLTKSLRVGDFEKSSILGLLAVTLPTGEATLSSSLQDPSASLGRGYFSLTTGMTFIRTFDPIVLYGGLGYLVNFEGDVGPNAEVDAGDGGFYRLGVGFAVNSQISLSSAFSGAYLGDARINGRRIGGSSREPLSIRIAATILQKQKEGRKGSRSVEPFLNFALTDDASDTQLGIAWTY